MSSNTCPAKYAVPEIYATVTPWIISQHTDGLHDFMCKAFGAMCKAFGAEELSRIPDADGSMDHTEVGIGDATGAIVPKGVAISEVLLPAIGEVVGRVRDPFGNIWWRQTYGEDVSEKEMAKREAEPKWAKATEYMQTSLVGGLNGVSP